MLEKLEEANMTKMCEELSQGWGMYNLQLFTDLETPSPIWFQKLINDFSDCDIHDIDSDTHLIHDIHDSDSERALIVPFVGRGRSCGTVAPGPGVFY